MADKHYASVEVTITPEMVEVGVKALGSHYHGGDPKAVVKKIYKAMREASDEDEATQLPSTRPPAAGQLPAEPGAIVPGPQPSPLPAPPMLPEVDNELPDEGDDGDDGDASTKPVPGSPGRPSTQPVPGAPNRPSTQPVPGAPNRPSTQPVPPTPNTQPSRTGITGTPQVDDDSVDKGGKY